MKNRFCLLLIGSLIFPALMFAQQIEKREKYDISKDKVLYTIGYAHLNTEWNWEYPKTINEHIKNTMEDNFRLLEKYPDYVFNFTGSRRYNMMKEYYPDSYKKVAEYIKPVSYTHLRAHETRHDLVCRLLLEKKKIKRTKQKPH